MTTTVCHVPRTMKVTIRLNFARLIDTIARFHCFCPNVEHNFSGSVMRYS